MTQAAKTSLGLLALAGVEPYELKKDEEYMNEAQREHFTKILKAWHSQIMEEAERTKSQLQEDMTNFADPNDRASQEEEFSLELRNRDRERKLLKKIEQTLYKIQEDEYGYCETCGVEIGIKRLEARPTAD
ncbi:TPA: RNA polymerase-binding protein DksA, partial [Mannheimia haemolytica]|nr:RNA polymerase-binding protein DksA [Mannheimia haemolytica]